MGYSFPIMKLCAFDIDGTLIDDTMENGEFVVYPEIIAALNAFLDQGNPILLASGRSLPGLVQFATKFHHLEQIYYSTSNGTCLYDTKGRLLYSSFIPYSVFLKMAQLYGGHDDWTYMCYAPGNVVGYVGLPNFAPEEARFNKMACEDFTNRVFSEDYQIEKAAMTTGSLDAHRLPLFLELGDYQSYATSSFFFEIVAHGVSKAKTVAILAEKLGIAPNEVYTFGDGENDLSMVANYHGTATGNAIDKVKQAAQFVAPNASERGVAFAMKEHWKLI